MRGRNSRTSDWRRRRFDRDGPLEIQRVRADPLVAIAAEVIVAEGVAYQDDDVHHQALREMFAEELEPVAMHHPFHVLITETTIGEQRPHLLQIGDRVQIAWRLLGAIATIQI